MAIEIGHSSRLTTLDSLRGIASLMVVFYHFSTVYFQEFTNITSITTFSIGHFGVDLFFILSGFVIFMSIRNVRSTTEFIAKRIVRLYPSYWISLVITYLAISYFGLTPGRETTLKEAIVGLSMLQGFIGYPNVDTSYWSLRPEIVFYFFISIILFFNLLKNLDLAILIISCLLVLDSYFHFPLLFSRILNIPFCGYFFSGILFYKLYSGEKKWYYYSGIISFCIINSIISKHPYSLVVIPLIYIVFFLFLYQKLSFLENKYLVFMGTISYPLYLIHQNVGLVILVQIKKHFPNSNYLGGFIVAIFVVILLATIITKYLEPAVSKILRKVILRVPLKEIG